MNNTEINFKPDNSIAEDAKIDAKSAVSWAKESMGLKLDFTPKSIKTLEKILDHLHNTMPKEDPDLEKCILQFTQIFGSYLGEVYVRTHNATWGIVEAENHQFLGIKCKDNDKTFWPHSRVQKRIVEGAENNIWRYYQALDESEEESLYQKIKSYFGFNSDTIS